MIYWVKFEGKLFFDTECTGPLSQTLPHKCQVQGCVEDHNTLLHPTPPALEENAKQTNTAMGYTSATHRTNQDGQSGGRASVTIATRAGERRVCLGVVPVKVRAKGGGRVVETCPIGQWS